LDHSIDNHHVKQEAKSLNFTLKFKLKTTATKIFLSSTDKKTDELARRVNIFHILETMKGTRELQTLYKRTPKISKFQNSKHLVLFLNPKLLNKSAICSMVKFVEYNFHFPILNRNLYVFILRTLTKQAVSLKYKKQSYLLYGEICWIKLYKIMILPYFP
jgi:hypothetical protein